MPFTLAHPAVVLPIRRLDKLALIVGSLAPDFVYFLQGQASLGIGHTAWGVVAVDLPLCVVVFWAYAFIAPVLWRYMPDMLNLNHCPKPTKSPKQWGVFVVSALIGIVSHIVLDSFTHKTGFFVVHFALFHQNFGGLPLFKWLQYGGGVVGLAVVGVYWLYNAKYRTKCTQHLTPNASNQTGDQHRPNQNYLNHDCLHQNLCNQMPVSATQKCAFWLGVFMILAVLLVLWQACCPLPINHYATWVIRLIDCFVLGVVVLSIAIKLGNKPRQQIKQ